MTMPAQKTLRERAHALVAQLLEFARTADQRSASRAALAELRHSIRVPLRAAPYVAPFLDPDKRQNRLPFPDRRLDEDRVFYLVTSLFAMHRSHAEKVSLGDAFRSMKDDSGSTEGRFLQLLSAEGRRLEDLLRHAVSLLAAHDKPLDWHRLIDDLLDWDYDDKRCQHRLARDFYRDDKSGETPAKGTSDED